ncbi:MAG: ABC transporter ATP-binding protein [Chloroflexota bacterium]
MNPIVQLKGVKKEYSMGKSTVQALRGIDLALARERFYAIVGPSGSGKSTLLHILGCMDRPSAGEVWLDGQAVHQMTEEQRTRVRAREIGFVFQAFHLNPILSVRENVAITLQFLRVRKTEAYQRAEAWLARVGLAHRLDHYPAELSGGERQRVAIARALAKQPSLVLADEPTGNLDSRTGQEIVTLLRETNRQSGTTLILVTHDGEIARQSDETIVLRDGQREGTAVSYPSQTVAETAQGQWTQP